MLFIDEAQKKFAVSTKKELSNGNPDIISFSYVTDCSVDANEMRHEIMDRDKEGRSVSFNPPQYEISYDFYCKIRLRHPYFDEIRFRLNQNSIKLPPSHHGRMAFRGSDYDHYIALGDEIKDILLQRAAKEAEAQVAAAAIKEDEWTCEYCGSGNKGGKFCPVCGAPRS